MKTYKLTVIIQHKGQPITSVFYLKAEDKKQAQYIIKSQILHYQSVVVRKVEVV